jgi:hypothetical protein
MPSVPDDAHMVRPAQLLAQWLWKRGANCICTDSADYICPTTSRRGSACEALPATEIGFPLTWRSAS